MNEMRKRVAEAILAAEGEDPDYESYPCEESAFTTYLMFLVIAGEERE